MIHTFTIHIIKLLSKRHIYAHQWSMWVPVTPHRWLLSIFKIFANMTGKKKSYCHQLSLCTSFTNLIAFFPLSSGKISTSGSILEVYWENSNLNPLKVKIMSAGRDQETMTFFWYTSWAPVGPSSTCFSKYPQENSLHRRKTPYHS